MLSRLLLTRQNEVDLVKDMAVAKDGTSTHDPRLCLSESIQQLLLDLHVINILSLLLHLLQVSSNLVQLVNRDYGSGVLITVFL